MTDAIIIIAFCIVAFVVASFGAVFAFVALGALIGLGLTLMVGGICLTAAHSQHVMRRRKI